MGDFFSGSSKEAPGPRIKETPWGPEMRDYLTNSMRTSQPRQYADMTDAERQGQGLLGDYLGQGTPEAYTLGMDQLRSTLTDQYDPSTSQYYQGLRSQMAAQEGQNIADLRRRQQLGGVFSFGPSYRAEGELMNTAANQRNTLLGSLYEQERQKQQAAGGQALQYAQYGDQSQLAKLAAAQQYGSLPRDIQNQRFGADYQNEQYRSQLAQLLLGYQPWYQPQMINKPSGFSELLGGVADIWGMVAGSGRPQQTGSGTRSLGGGWTGSSAKDFSQVGW